MKHVIVYQEAGKFCGWPANGGIWNWGNEIVVAFKQGVYKANPETHSIDRSRPQPRRMARSFDGGFSWEVEDPENFDGGETIDLRVPIDFTHRDLAIRCQGSQFRVSLDRCRTFHGPYAFSEFGLTEKLTSRTDYVVNGEQDCHFFLSVREPKVQAKLKDRSFCVRTTDGGCSFNRLGWMLLEPENVRSVMSSTVRVGEKHLVSLLRRRLDSSREGALWKRCWIDAVASEDDGQSWMFLSRLADTDTFEDQHNGNPPSLVRIPDGRLCGIYGFRSPPYGMRAKLSRDNGRTWGSEITLRDDARTWDIGYPKSIVRPDGKIVTTYYFATEDHSEQQIAATIWDPDRFG